MKSGRVVDVSLISICRPPPLFMWRSSRTPAHPGVFSGLVLFVSLVSWIAAMLTLLLWRKVSSSVIFPLIPFAFHCISHMTLHCHVFIYIDKKYSVICSPCYCFDSYILEVSNLFAIFCSDFLLDYNLVSVFNNYLYNA